MLPQKQPRILKLSDGRSVILDYDTDASTLQWILKNEIIPHEGPDYEYLRRIVRYRFQLTLEEFMSKQSFPPVTDYPLFSAKEFLDSLPPEAFDPQFWVHPIIYVIHHWMDSGRVLKPLIPDIICHSDFDAAIQILRREREKYYDAADAWIATNFNITREAFIELFIKSRVLHGDNAYARIGSNPGMIRRYRRDVLSLINQGNSWAHKAKTAVLNISRQSRRSLSEINRATKAIEAIAETVNSPELEKLIEESERIIEEWQRLRTTQMLREAQKTKKK